MPNNNNFIVGEAGSWGSFEKQKLLSAINPQKRKSEKVGKTQHVRERGGRGTWHTRVVGMLAAQPRAVLVAMGTGVLFFIFAYVGTTLFSIINFNIICNWGDVMLAGARYVMTVVTCTVEVTSVWAASAPAGGGEAAPAGPAARGGGGSIGYFSRR